MEDYASATTLLEIQEGKCSVGPGANHFQRTHRHTILMAKTIEPKPKERKAPVRSPEYEEARLKKELRLERDRLANYKRAFGEKSGKIESRITSLEAELANFQGQQSTFPVEQEKEALG